MQVSKIFWENPYLTELEVNVTSIDVIASPLIRLLPLLLPGDKNQTLGQLAATQLYEPRNRENKLFTSLTGLYCQLVIVLSCILTGAGAVN